MILIRCFSSSFHLIDLRTRLQKELHFSEVYNHRSNKPVGITGTLRKAGKMLLLNAISLVRALNTAYMGIQAFEVEENS